MTSTKKVTYVIVFVSILSLSLAIDNAIPFFQTERNELLLSSAYNECEMCRIAGLSPFTTAVYNLTKTSGVFDKLFDVSFKNPTEIASAFFLSGMYFSQNMQLTTGCQNRLPALPYAGTLPLEDSNAGEKAFLKGLTPLGYFKPFANAVENYFIKLGIMTPFTMQPLAYSYYKELEQSLRALGPLDTVVAHLYALTVANVNIMKSYGEPTPEIVAYLMKKWIEDFEA